MRGQACLYARVHPSAQPQPVLLLHAVTCATCFERKFCVRVWGDACACMRVCTCAQVSTQSLSNSFKAATKGTDAESFSTCNKTNGTINQVQTGMLQEKKENYASMLLLKLCPGTDSNFLSIHIFFIKIQSEHSRGKLMPRH